MGVKATLVRLERPVQHQVEVVCRNSLQFAGKAWPEDALGHPGGMGGIWSYRSDQVVWVECEKSEEEDGPGLSPRGRGDNI